MNARDRLFDTYRAWHHHALNCEECAPWRVPSRGPYSDQAPDLRWFSDVNAVIDCQPGLALLGDWRKAATAMMQDRPL